MTARQVPSVLLADRRWRLLGVAVIAAIAVVVWLVAFFVPEGSRLTALSSESSGLTHALAKDRAELKALRAELGRTPSAPGAERRIEQLVPGTANLSVYAQTITATTNASGVMVTAFEPHASVPVRGTSIEETPVTVVLKGAYDHILAFIERLGLLTRLTVVHGLSVSGGGPGSNRATLLDVVARLRIFHATSGALRGAPTGSLPPSTNGGSSPATAVCGASRDPFDPSGEPPPPGSPARC